MNDDTMPSRLAEVLADYEAIKSDRDTWRRKYIEQGESLARARKWARLWKNRAACYSFGHRIAEERCAARTAELAAMKGKDAGFWTADEKRRYGRPWGTP